MKTSTVTNAKNQFSALVREVKRGNSVLITDRGTPVARLEPVLPDEGSEDERIERLTRKGILSPSRGHWPKDLFTRPLPKTKTGASIVQALLDERKEAR